MLTLYEFRPKSAEWCAFRDEMLREGYAPVTRYERVTPSDPSIVYPMGDHYLSDRGEKCWPWVIFAGSPTRGYILRGIAPLPVAPPPPKPSRRATGRKITAREAKAAKVPITHAWSNCRSAQAAKWAARHPEFTRYDVARLFELSYASVCNALRRFGIEKPPCVKDRTNEEIETLKRRLKL